MRDGFNNNALFDFVFQEDTESLRKELERGADPNQYNSDGLTLLHLAAWCGSLEMVSLLLSMGADPDIREKYGDEPPLPVDMATMAYGHLTWDGGPSAVTRRFDPVIKLLIEHMKEDPRLEP